MGLGLDIGSAWDSFSGGVGDLLSNPITTAATASSYGPWIAGGATLLGSLLNNSTSRSLASQQQAFSAQQAGSIYQRGAADLAAAGINPIIAYSSPAAMASYSQPNIQPSLSLAAQSFVSAKDSLESADLKHSQQHYTNAQTTTERKRPDLLVAETDATSAHSANLKADTMLKHEQAATQRFQQKVLDNEATYKEAQTFLTYMETKLTDARWAGQLAETDYTKQRADVERQKQILNSPDVHNVLTHEDASNFGAWLRSFNPLQFIKGR